MQPIKSRNLKNLNAAILGGVMLLGAGGAAMAQDQGQDQGMTKPNPTAMSGTSDSTDAGLSSVTTAKVDLSQAVDMAEKATGGRAVDVTAADEAGKGGWEVELAQNDGTMKTVLVDMSSGAVDQNPQRENDSAQSREGERAGTDENRPDEERADSGEDRGDRKDGEYRDSGEREHDGEYRDGGERHDEGASDEERGDEHGQDRERGEMNN